MSRTRRTLCIAVVGLLILFLITVEFYANLQNETLHHEFRDIEQFRTARSVKFILDTSGQYRIYPRIFRKKQLSGPEAPILALVSHSTVEHLGLLPALVSRWEGPVSLAVFAQSGDVARVAQQVQRLRECDQNIGFFVDFQLVAPLNDLNSDSHLVLEEQEYLTDDERSVRCMEIGWLKLVPQNLETVNYAHSSPYPNNLLRNIGRRFSEAEYNLVTDIDMLPNKGLHGLFWDFIKTRNTNIDFSLPPALEVFVVPAFEINPTESVPQTKPELLKLLSRFVVRPFYFEVCWKCQQPTDYQTWQNSPTRRDLAVSHQVEWRDPWEPFFISHRTSPFYDERFQQYGFNRISLACELHIAGYTFSVLNNAFLVHQGFKTRKIFHSTKEEELNKNRALFAAFKKELETAYPDSSRRCW